MQQPEEGSSLRGCRPSKRVPRQKSRSWATVPSPSIQRLRLRRRICLWAARPISCRDRPEAVKPGCCRHARAGGTSSVFRRIWTYACAGAALLWAFSKTSPYSRHPFSGTRCSGICTAITRPFTEISGPAETVAVTMVLRPLISSTLARISIGGPSGVGFR